MAAGCAARATRPASGLPNGGLDFVAIDLSSGALSVLLEVPYSRPVDPLSLLSIDALDLEVAPNGDVYAAEHVVYQYAEFLQLVRRVPEPGESLSGPLVGLTCAIDEVGRRWIAGRDAFSPLSSGSINLGGDGSPLEFGVGVRSSCS